MTPQSPNSCRRVYGVDFSGASKAGKKIWIASGLIEGNALHIQACHRAQDLPGSGADRDRCLAALRNLIAWEGPGVFGLDFPFGLPRALIKEGTWDGFVLPFPDRYASPEEFRHICYQEANGSELKRVTDRESHTPFSPYNIRLYRQTYYGIRDLLAPLVRDGLVWVLPMQPALPDRPWVMEICPASTLKRENLYQVSYKGKGRAKYAARVGILAAIQEMGPLFVPAPLRSAILDDIEGDALDSLVAAFSVFRTLRDLSSLAVVGNGAYAMEGYVYA